MSAGADILEKPTWSRPLAAEPRVRPDALVITFDNHFLGAHTNDIVRPVDGAPVNFLRWAAIRSEERVL